MKIIVAMILIFCVAGCEQVNLGDGSKLKEPENTRSWLNPPDLDLGHYGREINNADIFEVVFSKAHYALKGDLLENHFSAISENEAVAYTGDYFRCSVNKKPYLIRAVFGGFGGYSVFLLGADLSVHHSSLGRETIVNKSALVICLENIPRELFVSLSSAG